MHVAGESDRLIVPEKSMNKERKTRPAKASSAASLFDDLPSEESMEGRGLTKENIGPSSPDRTQCGNVPNLEPQKCARKV